MAISYYAEDVKLPALRKRETNEWIRTIASLYDKKCGDIAYIFCSVSYTHLTLPTIDDV